VDFLDVAILALRLALVAVLYLFLAMVMRAAIRGLRTAAPRMAEPAPAAPASRAAPAARAAHSAGLRLVVREPGSSDLESGQLVELIDGAVLGRSARAEVVIADSSVSAEHARVFRVGRAWVVTDLGSTNGTQVNETPVNGEMPLAANDVLTLGSVRLQVVAR
jgi:hypothetical protein